MSPLLLLGAAGVGALLLFGKSEDMTRSKGPSGYTWQIVNTKRTTVQAGRNLAEYAVYTDPQAFGVKERTLVVRFLTDGTTDYEIERNPIVPEGYYKAAASDFQLKPKSLLGL